MTTDQSSEQSDCPHIDHGDFTLCETERKRRADQSSEQDVTRALWLVESRLVNDADWERVGGILAAAVRDLTAKLDEALLAKAIWREERNEIAAERDRLREALETIASGDHPMRPPPSEVPPPKWLYPASFWWHYLSPEEVARAALQENT